MAELKTQPTKSPTRKIWAVIIAGAITGAVQGLLMMVLPDEIAKQIVEPLAPFVMLGVVTLAGYITKDRA